MCGIDLSDGMKQWADRVNAEARRNYENNQRDAITTQWLTEVHPGKIHLEEAEEYRRFLMVNSIWSMEEYRSSKMEWWERWLAFKAELSSL